LTVLEDANGRQQVGVPVMAVCVPVRDADFQVVGTLGFGIRPQGEFTEILQLGQKGASGETYAIDGQYRMVSNSRFTEDLIILGLLPDEPGVQSLLRVLVVDPGGDMTEAHRVTKRRSEMPPTFMAESLAAGQSGVNVDGYNDYRGRPVIGAWTWLPKYSIGVATEIDVAEAYRPLTILRWTFRGLMALLVLTSVAIFIFTIVVARLRREARKAAIDAKQLGQYTLERKLGGGAMGVVYKGRHAMLRRPTAIKMLDFDKVNDDSIQRFEKEVQITCQLNNPHTVAIYDYGRTPEGLFYYAMEFLNGIDLQDLVEQHGPQREARVISIMRQMCESLYEAHTLGLVHRDIKPANTMLNRRGGVPDFVKVLDFGLVKAVDEDKRNQQTSAGSLTGTPLYMSPEAIQTPQLVDARSDIYAVGATSFFLLSGRPPFQSESLVELCDMQVNRQPPSLREELGVDCSRELEGVIDACLAKSPAQRPQTALDLSQRLERCPITEPWTYDMGDVWWGRFERGQSTSGFVASAKTDSKQVAHDRTIIGEIDDDAN
jgi:predicted Ser/Thr protein kinase